MYLLHCNMFPVVIQANGNLTGEPKLPFLKKQMLQKQAMKYSHQKAVGGGVIV